MSGSLSILASPNLVVPEVKTPSSEEFDKTIQEVGLDGNATDGMSFTAKARKSKKSYPYALYNLAGSEDRKNLTKPHYLAWEEFIFSTRIKLSVQENSMLKIDFTLFRIKFQVGLDSYSSPRQILVTVPLSTSLSRNSLPATTAQPYFLWCPSCFYDPWSWFYSTLSYRLSAK